MRTSAVTEKHEEVIREFYLELDGLEIIQEMTGLTEKTISAFATKHLGLRKRDRVRASHTKHTRRKPVSMAEDPRKPENIKMLRTGICKGINGIPCNGKIRMDKTEVEGLTCWLVICHYGHTFSFFLPDKIKN